MALLSISRFIGKQVRLNYREPTVAKILSDPIVIALMKADGVDAAVLEAQLSSIAQNLASVRQRARCPGA
jgi:hypothetical protein